MATYTRKLLAQGQVAATTPASIYANPASTVSHLHSILIHNTNTSSETVIIAFTQDNAASLGTYAASDIMYKLTVAVNETVLLEFRGEGATLTDQNDAIFASTTTGSKVNYVIFGVKVA